MSRILVLSKLVVRRLCQKFECCGIHRNGTCHQKTGQQTKYNVQNDNEQHDGLGNCNKCQKLGSHELVTMVLELFRKSKFCKYKLNFCLISPKEI